jgi:hypothetical protein
VEREFRDGRAPSLRHPAAGWEPMTDVCREFGISRKTGYKIFNRYREHGCDALSDRSRRPVRYATSYPRRVRSHLGGRIVAIDVAGIKMTESMRTEAGVSWPSVIGSARHDPAARIQMSICSLSSSQSCCRGRQPAEGHRLVWSGASKMPRWQGEVPVLVFITIKRPRGSDPVMGRASL